MTGEPRQEAERTKALLSGSALTVARIKHQTGRLTVTDEDFFCDHVTGDVTRRPGKD